MPNKKANSKKKPNYKYRLAVLEGTPHKAAAERYGEPTTEKGRKIGGVSEKKKAASKKSSAKKTPVKKFKKDKEKKTAATDKQTSNRSKKKPNYKYRLAVLEGTPHKAAAERYGEPTTEEGRKIGGVSKKKKAASKKK